VWTVTSLVRAGGKQVVVNLIVDISKLCSSDGGALMLFVSGNDFLERSCFHAY
jgi:hypothetical protein